MKNFILTVSIVLSCISLTLNIVLLKEMERFRCEIDRILMPVGDDDLEKLMEEIKKLSNTNINIDKDT
jgi:hypothetical protein